MLVVLILCLTVISAIILNSDVSLEFPPTISKCPDYYQNTSGAACRDVHSISTTPSFSSDESGTISCKNIDFSDTSLFPNSGNTGNGKLGALCEKKKWATSCGVNWDGITNNDVICYDN